MTEQELQQYLLSYYPQENARCEWKEFKNLKISFCGDEKYWEKNTFLTNTLAKLNKKPYFCTQIIGKTII